MHWRLCVCVVCVSMCACVRRAPMFGVCSVCACVFGVHLCLAVCLCVRRVLVSGCVCVCARCVPVSDYVFGVRLWLVCVCVIGV